MATDSTLQKIADNLLAQFDKTLLDNSTDMFQAIVDNLHFIVIYFYNLGEPDTVRPSLICDRIKDDETELLIRVLSFGPVLEVKAPISFVWLIRNRINKQRQYAKAP